MVLLFPFIISYDDNLVFIKIIYIFAEKFLMEILHEIWKPLDFIGFPLYAVSNIGRLKRIDSNYILKQSVRRGYKQAAITKGKKNTSKSFFIHRLVAMAFIPNPNNYEQVNHKDENRLNNKVDNLEWVSPKMNSNWGTRNNRIANFHKGKVYSECPIIIIKPNGEEVEYKSKAECARDNNISTKAISRVLKGQQKATIEGYKFKLVEENYTYKESKQKKVSKEKVYKRIVQIDLKGNVIKIYCSKIEAAKELGKTVKEIECLCIKMYDTICDTLLFYEDKFNSLSKENKIASILEVIKDKTDIIYQFDLDGYMIKEWNNITEITKEDVYKCQYIRDCLNEKKLLHHNSFWIYKRNYSYSKLMDKVAKAKETFWKGKEVIQYTVDGKYIRSYKSIGEAARANNFNEYSISLCCKGKQGTHKGFKFEFKDTHCM